MSAPRLTWRFHFSPVYRAEMTFADVPGGFISAARNYDGGWTPVVVRTVGGGVWFGPGFTARHAAQRWAEQLAATGDYEQATRCEAVPR